MTRGMIDEATTVTKAMYEADPPKLDHLNAIVKAADTGDQTLLTLRLMQRREALDLIACYLSGQIDERRWTDHLADNPVLAEEWARREAVVRSARAL